MKKINIGQHKIVIILLLILLFLITGQRFYNNFPQKSISFLDSYKIAMKSAKEWDKNSGLYYATSVDKQDDPENGNDGKRNHWNFDFAIPNSSNHYAIEINFGSITLTKKIKGQKVKKDNLIYLNEININSDSALSDIKSSFCLKPGKGWFIGYHFTLSKDGYIPIFDVMGVDSNNNTCKISINSTNKKIIQAKHQILTKGELCIKKEKLSLDNTHPWGCVGANIDPNNPKNILAWGYYYINDIHIRPFIKESNNQGITWNSININDQILDSWYFRKYNDISEKIIVTHSNIYRFDNSNKLVNKFFEKSVNIESVFHNKKFIALLVGDYAYIFSDFSDTYKKIIVPQNTSCIKLNSNNQIFAISQKSIFTLKNGQWEEVFTSEDMTIQDIDFGSNFVIYLTKNNLFIDTGISKIKINNKYKVQQVFFNKVESSYKCFWGFGNGKIVKFMKEGESDVYTEKVVNNISGQFTLVDFIDEKEMMLCSVPKLVWREMKG